MPHHSVSSLNITKCHTVTNSTQYHIHHSMSLSCSIIHQCHTLHIMSQHHSMSHIVTLSMSHIVTVSMSYSTIHPSSSHSVTHCHTSMSHKVSQHCHNVIQFIYHSVSQCQCHIVHTLFIVTMSHTIIKCHTYHSISCVTQCHTRHSMSCNVTVSHSVTITHHTMSWFLAPLFPVFSQDWVAGLLGSDGSSGVHWRLPFGSVHGCPELNLCWGLVSGGSTRLLAHMELKRPCITKGTLERQLPATALTQ